MGWSESHIVSLPVKYQRKSRSSNIHRTEFTLTKVFTVLTCLTQCTHKEQEMKNSKFKFLNWVSFSLGSQLFQVQFQAQHALHDPEHCRRGSSRLHYWVCSHTNTSAVVFIGRPSDLPGSGGDRPRGDFHVGSVKGWRLPSTRAGLWEGVKVHAAHRSVWLLPGLSQQPPGATGHQRAGQQWPCSPLHRRSYYHCHPRKHKVWGFHIYLPGPGSGLEHNILSDVGNSLLFYQMDTFSGTKNFKHILYCKTWF